MTIFRSLLAFCLMAGLLPASAVPAVPVAAGTPLDTPAATAAALEGAGQTRRYLLTQLGAPAVTTLRTTDGKSATTFGVRSDEMVTKATLRLRYSYSPALITAMSHLKITVNDETVAVLPLPKEQAGQSQVREIALDPRFFSDFNRLGWQFIGHYTTDCEDPMNSTLWADISGSSELDLTVVPLAQKSDLAKLPEPFFDKRDLKRLNLPFVFAARPGLSTLRAAAVAASWFGQLAGWRGARFSGHLNSLPKGHAVVLATNTERPAFLDAITPKIGLASGPTLRIITNPEDGYSKLLLVLGRDAADLDTAVNGLALGTATLSGTEVALSKNGKGENAKEHMDKPRAAYDAPNWVRLDRPMKFGELVESAQQLQVFGHTPDMVRLNLRIPPDLFTWRSRGVPVDLKYRYTPPLHVSESRVSMSINDELVQSFNLRPSGKGGEGDRVRLPLLDDALLGESKEVLIPAFKVGTRNQLQYGFSFTYDKVGACRDTQTDNVRSIIDADSSINFSGFPHYAEMPHLGYFATAGFPFTKYADLAQTVVVMPNTPNEADIAVLLTVLGRMGESTGFPATRVRLAGPDDLAPLKDADILIIGSAPRQALLDKWGGQLPAIISGPARRISEPARAVNLIYDWLGFATAPDPSVISQAHVQGSGPLGAVLGFESPLTPERSVVAITGVAPESMAQVLDALENPGLVKTIHGSAVFVRDQKVDSVLAGHTYFIGNIPFLTMIWFGLSEHPILLACMSVLAILLFGFLLWRALKRVAARRIKGKKP